MSGGYSFTGESGATWELHSRRLGDPGSFGSAYEGEAADGTPIAIKLLELAGDEPEEYWSREIQIAERLTKVPHGGLVVPFDYAQEQTRILIVMDRADATLSLVAGGMEEVDVLPILDDICVGLDELHSARTHHRDLKPSNVLRFGTQWKIADFGISRYVADPTSERTMAHFGAAGYKAPERLNGGPSLDQSDLYSLGCIAVALLTGSPPFATDSDYDIGASHACDVVELPNHISPQLRLLITRLLRKDPELRPRHATDVRRALSDIRSPSVVSVSLAQAVATHEQLAAEQEANDALVEMRQERFLGRQTESLAQLAAMLEELATDVTPVLPQATLSSNSFSTGFILDCGTVRLAVSVREEAESLDPNDPWLHIGTVEAQNSAVHSWAIRWIGSFWDGSELHWLERPLEPVVEAPSSAALLSMRKLRNETRSVRSVNEGEKAGLTHLTSQSLQASLEETFTIVNRLSHPNS